MIIWSAVQPLAVSYLYRHSNLSAPVPPARVRNRRSWKPLYSRRWWYELQLWNHGGVDRHNWSSAMNGCDFFRRNLQGRSGGVALCIRKCLDCLELNDGGDRVQCLWERMVGRSTRQISWWASVLNHPTRRPISSEETDEIFSKQLGEISWSPLFLWGT